VTLDEKIAQAQRHVDSGRRIIERQRALIARLGSPAAIDLLVVFERTQQIFESDLADALDGRYRLDLRDDQANG
jgi:hypothetical protein